MAGCLEHLLCIWNQSACLIVITAPGPVCRYEVLIDGESKKSGSLFEDFSPSFNPPEEIDDPSDFKPDDWVDEPK